MISNDQEICEDHADMAQQRSTGREAEFAGQLFFRLWGASHTRIAVALESLGLRPALFALLNLIGARDGAIQQERGSAMGIGPSTMVAVLAQLEKAGLAKRRPH